jgi:hypothetical protein
MLPALAQTTITTGGAFAVLSFLAAPAILTNASTILALGTSNRLARASDRARAASAAIVGSKGPSDDSLLKFYQRDFDSATRRAGLLITALRRFYLAAGCFATGTCVALLGAFAEYFHIPVLPLAAQIATIALALTGVGGLAHGSLTLLGETRIALRTLEEQHAAITAWRATRGISNTEASNIARAAGGQP